MGRARVRMGTLFATVLAASGMASGEVTLLEQFAPGLGTLVSCGFDPAAGRVWVYDAFGGVISSYTTSGVFVSSVPRAGESANDVDIEIAPEALTLGSTPIPAGTLLFINGESGAADIYALNNVTGAVIATLTPAFGASHVVGGAYHPGRNTFFLVQDKVPGGANANRVAEIDPVTGAVLNTFQTTGAYTVNYGDIDVNAATGNLMLVSSDESSIGEFTPTGSFVQSLALPVGVGSLSGIGMDDATGEAWVSGTGGTVWRLGCLPALCANADLNCNGVVNIDDLLAVINGWGRCAAPLCPGDCAPEPCGDGVVNIDDLLAVINAWG